jgi:hypothetical protein
MNSHNFKYLTSYTKAAPLAVFRIFFGIMMFLSVVRFWSYGWIDKLYIQPDFFFSYHGFEWVKPLGPWTYLLFGLCGLSALAVAVGFKYRWAIVSFFLSFTYIELMDKTTYLNHYYFISILSFLMIFLPANAYFSWDAKKDPDRAFEYIPRWNIDAVQLLLAIVYFYAGLAKLNSDWLIGGMPLKIWLPSKYDLPLLGDFLHQEWLIYAFSWGGAIYDLSIPFLLLWKRTRWMAFGLVIVFHVLTRVLFPIGMFPYIMIVSATIFFGAAVHDKIVAFLAGILGIKKEYFDNGRQQVVLLPVRNRIRLSVLAVFFVLQLLVPFRYLAYPGELFWTEQGYRFSWRVMLMEKAGYAHFRVVEGTTGRQFYIDNTDFLTAFQEKQMATQPDFILEYAHFLRDHFEAQGYQEVEVYVESYVALNGRISRPYIDPGVNLAEIHHSFKHKDWILPFDDEIKGL